MRFLILSDIHGNNIALNHILSSVPNERYDKILVLGDNIGDGPCPDKVLQTLMDRDAILIQGNRELLACQHFEGNSITKDALQWDFMRRTLSYLTLRMRRLIAETPQSYSVPADDMSILMVHGSPFFIRELLFPNYPSRLNASLDYINEHILLCGHNHLQFSYIFNDKLALNPGSVGLCQTGEPFRADYALIDVRQGQFSFELNHIYYNGSLIHKEFENRGLFDNGIWGRIAYMEMSEGKMYINSFARFVFQLAKNADLGTDPIPDEIWEKASAEWDWMPTN